MHKLMKFSYDRWLVLPVKETVEETLKNLKRVDGVRYIVFTDGYWFDIYDKTSFLEDKVPQVEYEGREISLNWAIIWGCLWEKT